MPRPPERLVLRGGRVLTMDPQIGDFERAGVLVERGRVAAVGPAVAAEDAEVIDTTRGIVLPGFVDTHRHMWQAILRGAGADHTLADYFSRVSGPLGAAMRPRDIHLGNLLSALGALDAGVTTVQDTSNAQNSPGHSDAAVQALRDAGIRAVFAYGPATDPGSAPPPDAWSDNAARVRKRLLPSDDGLVTMALLAGARDDDAIRRNWDLAERLDLPIAVHTRAAHFDSPILRYRRLGALRPRTLYIHCTGLGADEFRLIAESGGAVSISPAIELMMGHGWPPVAEAFAAGLHPSLSVDVEVTAGGDLFTAMRAAFQVGRFDLFETGSHAAMRRITTRHILESATIAGARALGLDGRTGSITPGKQADLIVLRADRPGVAPLYDPAGTIVLQMDRADVDTVLVAGRVLKRDGRLVRDDLPRLLREADEARDRLARLQPPNGWNPETNG